MLSLQLLLPWNSFCLFDNRHEIGSSQTTNRENMKKLHYMLRKRYESVPPKWTRFKITFNVVFIISGVPSRTALTHVYRARIPASCSKIYEQRPNLVKISRQCWTLYMTTSAHFCAHLERHSLNIVTWWNVTRDRVFIGNRIYCTLI
jgi:hypothetical protein